VKSCPQCNHDYYDDTLNFCLDDGAPLISAIATQGFVTRPEPPTAVWSDSQLRNAQTLRQISSVTFAEQENAIAVMPFVNMSRDEDIEYFSDGLAEELLNVLSKIRGLRVAARSSSFSFKGRSATVAEVGRVLNVGSVLEGSIRLSGDRMRIGVQLSEVTNGFQLWSETYDRTLEDIFAIQDDIAQSVVAELRQRLLGEVPDEDARQQVVSEVSEAVRGRAADPEAYRLMLLGRYFLDRTTREDTARAIDYFKQALETDSNYALCWAELSRAYSIEAGHTWVNTAEGFERSREAAMKALSLEPDLPEGHAYLGRVQLAHDWDFSGAEASYGRAMKLAPGNASVLDGAAVLWYKLGRLDEALDLSRRVLEQDPLSAAYWHNLGLAAHAAGRLEESEAAFRRALELAPQRFVSAALLALVLLDKGDPEAALAQASAEADDFWRRWSLAIIQHVACNSGVADELLKDLIEEYAEGNAYQIAEIYAVRGEMDEAFRWLEKANEERDTGATHARVNPRFRALHSDERWPAVLKKIGFDE
jgi:adenylate cyclase